MHLLPISLGNVKAYHAVSLAAVTGAQRKGRRELGVGGGGGSAKTTPARPGLKQHHFA